MLNEEILKIVEHNKALQAENILLKNRVEQFQQAYDSLHHLVQQLRRAQFGKKSERFVDDENRQGSLFGGMPAVAPENSAEEEKTEVAAHQRKKKNTSGKEIQRRIEIIPLPDDEKICPCGKCMVVIRYETKNINHYQPAVFEIIEQRREVAACPSGCAGSIKTAPAPLHILPKIGASEELLSFLVVSKMDDRQPLYHLEKQLRERHGMDCSRQTMARWVIDLMTPLRPITNLLKDEIIEYDIAACDATTLQVLKEPGRAAETKSYAYCMRGGPPEKPVILYEYNFKEHKKFVMDWFAGFSGYLHVDGDDFFEMVGNAENNHLVNCNGHARRKFEPIAKSSAKKVGIAKEAMRFYKEIYRIERKAKNENMTPEQRHALRQKESKPLFEKFMEWLSGIYQTVMPKSPLGKAINYCLKRTKGLARFLDDGRLEIDNNLTEQMIKPFVIARKNFLFTDSQDGARALCLHFSLTQTAKANGLDPYHYYVRLLKSIPHCMSVEDYEKLLPWNMRTHYPEFA